MIIWRALVTTSNTILEEWDTWRLLCGLTVVCFITMACIMASGTESSIPLQISVTNRVQVLLSFVLSAFIGIVLGRWDNLRNNALAGVWTALENLCLLSSMWCETDTFQDQELRSRIERHSRLILRLVFYAAQAKGDLSALITEGLLLEEEARVLTPVLVGTRAHVVIGWLQKTFKHMYEAEYYGFANMGDVSSNVAAVRGGCGLTLGIIGCPLPFGYVHLLYWIVQLLLLLLAINTGILFAVMMARRHNGELLYHSPPTYQPLTRCVGIGNGEYSYDDESGKHYPENERIWFFNIFMQTTLGNVVFALFTQGTSAVSCRREA